MSDEKNPEEEVKTYSESFEKFELSQHSDPMSRLYFALLKTFTPEFQDEQSEKTRKLLNVADVMNEKIAEVMSTREGREIFYKRLVKEVGED